MLKSIANRMLVKRMARKFSSQTVLNEQKFQNLQEMLSNRNDEFELEFEEFRSSIKKENADRKVFEHPLDYEDNSLNFGQARMDKLFYDMVGPE